MTMRDDELARARFLGKARRFYQREAKPLTRWIRISERSYVRLEFKWQDMWFGVFPKWEGDQIDIWVCIIPMLPIHLRKRTKGWLIL